MGSMEVRLLAILFTIVLKSVRSTPSQDDFEMGSNNGTFTVMEGKIVGGSIAAIKNFPHAVFLNAECNNNKWLCGSSLINQQVLLTAAHCVYNCKKNFKKIEAYAGSTDFTKASSLRHVAMYIMHGDYDDVTARCDIAVILLNKKFEYSQFIKRVIMKPNKPSGKLKAIVAGWGAINEEQDVLTTLKVVDQTVWSPHNCEKILHMHKGTICANEGKGSYAYAGDSGSGLITKDFQIIGLVSFRDPVKKDLTVYTDVPYYFNWIREKIYKMWCHKKKG